jgi:hypothetical protein
MARFLSPNSAQGDNAMGDSLSFDGSPLVIAFEPFLEGQSTSHGLSHIDPESIVDSWSANPPPVANNTTNGCVGK